MIIKTKKDFDPFFLEITPKLTAKKYVEVCNKFKAMDFWYEPRNGLKELEGKIGQCYLYINATGHIFSDYKLDKEGLKPLEIISVEDFLREEDYPTIIPSEEKYGGIFYKDKRYDETPKGIQQLVDDFSKNNQGVVFPKEDERTYGTKNKKSLLPNPKNIEEEVYGTPRYNDVLIEENRVLIKQICEYLREKENDD